MLFDQILWRIWNSTEVDNGRSSFPKRLQTVVSYIKSMEKMNSDSASWPYARKRPSALLSACEKQIKASDEVK